MIKVRCGCAAVTVGLQLVKPVLAAMWVGIAVPSSNRPGSSFKGEERELTVHCSQKIPHRSPYLPYSNRSHISYKTDQWPSQLLSIPQARIPAERSGVRYARGAERSVRITFRPGRQRLFGARLVE